MLFSFFNGKQYEFSSFFTTFVLQKENNAKPKSDFETLRKWLYQKRQKGAYKANITAVKETGIDEVS